MPVEPPEEREAAATTRAETMLALGEALAIDLEALAFLARRFEQRLDVLDAAEPAQRRELIALVAEDFDELASAFKTMAAAVERSGEA